MNSTINSALLYYEDPNGNVSALLQRTTSKSTRKYFNGTSWSEEWVDITSQDSKSLPDAFQNPTGMNPSNDSFELGPYSNTFYESTDMLDANATYSTPFTSGANFSSWTVGSLFFSPSNASQLGGSIVFAGYSVDPSGTGNFSAGMYCISSYAQWWLGRWHLHQHRYRLSVTSPNQILRCLARMMLLGSMAPNRCYLLEGQGHCRTIRFRLRGLPV